MTIEEMNRNDLSAVEAFYAQEGYSIRYDDYRTMMRLQDDPELFDELTADWTVVSAPLFPGA